jgi:hypothetical protein
MDTESDCDANSAAGPVGKRGENGQKYEAKTERGRAGGTVEGCGRGLMRLFSWAVSERDGRPEW